MSEETTPTPEVEAPEVKTFTQEEVDALTGGLKSKVDELLNEKKTVAQRAREAEAEATRITQESAKKSGELEAFETSLRGEFSKEREALTARLEALQNSNIASTKKAVLGSFGSDFLAVESLDLISSLVKTEFDGSEVKTQFTDFSGNVITTDAAEFRKWMGNHPSISHLMKADVAIGGGATGGKGSNGGAGGVPKTLEECKGDRKKEAEYFNSQLGN